MTSLDIVSLKADQIAHDAKKLGVSIVKIDKSRNIFLDFMNLPLKCVSMVTLGKKFNSKIGN